MTDLYDELHKAELRNARFGALIRGDIEKANEVSRSLIFYEDNKRTM